MNENANEENDKVREATFLSHLLFYRLSIFPLIHWERTFYFSPRPRRSPFLWNTRPGECELPHHPPLATPSRILFSARHDHSVLQGSALRASTSVPDSRGTDLLRLRRRQLRRHESEMWNFHTITKRNDFIAANFVAGLRSITLALRDRSTFSSGNICFDVHR